MTTLAINLNGIKKQTLHFIVLNNLQYSVENNKESLGALSLFWQILSTLQQINSLFAK